MATGLVALLDDIAGITRLAAASLDDVGAATARAGSKAIGVVVDDAAVTPRYVMGFDPKRELPMIWRIALGSFRNKLVFILPAALALSALAPWAITPLLMLGGAYLCFEAAEKIIEALSGHHAEDAAPDAVDAATLEADKVSGAIRTDFILSAEIMAIALADVADRPLLTQAIVLALVGIAITIGVYGVVALIVKMDDIGLHLAKRGPSAVQAIGRGLVKGMPIVMRMLSVVGTAAMLWVGGGIVVHGLESFGLTAIPHLIHAASGHAARAVPAIAGIATWIVEAACAGIVGMTIGSMIAVALHAIRRPAAAAATTPGSQNAH